MFYLLVLVKLKRSNVACRFLFNVLLGCAIVQSRCDLRCRGVAISERVCLHCLAFRIADPNRIGARTIPQPLPALWQQTVAIRIRR